MFDKALITKIVKTSCQGTAQSEMEIHLAQQEQSAITTEVPAAEIALHTPPRQGIKLKRNRSRGIVVAGP